MCQWVHIQPLLNAGNEDAIGEDEILGVMRRAFIDTNTQEAIDRSVFGSPTYFVDGDMFYGQDRLELVARAMERAFKDTWPEITE